MKIAIVGSEEKYWTPEQREKVVRRIKKILYQPYVIMGDKGFHETMIKPVTLISGGCPKGGVDIWAEIVADILGIPKDIKNPEINQWRDSMTIDVNDDEIKLMGYKSRNILIAEECDVLYCFDPAYRDWSGGRWTMKHAEKLGKEIHLELIE